MHYIITIFLILFAQTVSADNICSQISTDKATEEHFAQNMSDELNITYNGKSYQFSTKWSSGTCYGEKIVVSTDNISDKHHELHCDGNGCGMGQYISFVSLNNKHYNIAHSKLEVKAAFNKLNGWQNLSEKEKKLLLYRNSHPDIYLMSPDSHSEIICSNDNNKQYHLRPLHKEPMCDAILESKKQITFPDGYEEQIISEFYSTYNPSQRIIIDINNDGVKEALIPYQFVSVAGCGCGYKTIKLIDANDKIIENTENDFYKNFIKTNYLNCGEWLRLIKYDNSYYLEKFYGRHKHRIRSKEIIPLSGENAFKPICQYINEAPINLEPVTESY